MKKQGKTNKKLTPIYEDNEFAAITETMEDEVKKESAALELKEVPKPVLPGKRKKKSNDVKNTEETKVPEEKKNVQIFEQVHYRAKRYTTDNKLKLMDYFCDLLDKDLKKKGY